jgi:translation elongation factor EF-1alpha
MSFLLCGQTDSGKSTIAGHLLLNNGYFNTFLNTDDEKMYRKYIESANDQLNTSKSKYSILLDLIDGEILNNKTKTQEFNLINFSSKQNKPYQLIDTPGHKLYIRALIEGLYKIDLDIIVLVVSSIDNEFIESFEKGTIKEDLLLARSTGCKNLLILWNKCDVCLKSNHHKELIEDYAKKLSFSNPIHLDVSGYTGQNLDQILPVVDKFKTIKTEFETEQNQEITPTTTLNINCLLFPTSNELITAGYQCVIHTPNCGEIDIEIMKIKQGFKIISGKPNTIKIADLSKKQFKKFKYGDRIIFRNATNTLGFGRLDKQ